MSNVFSFGTIGFIATIVLLVLFVVTMIVRQYRRCPSNRVLVVYGKVRGERAARCMHGGGVFIVPLLQSYAFLNLEPMTIEIEMTSALSKKNIRVNVPSTFTIGISTQPEIMNNAAERLLGLGEKEIAAQAKDIILGQTRLVIATLSIEEINQDREKFLDLVNKNVSTEVSKIGLELINVNIRDITDESGYIEALGRKAASEAINQAKVEVAEADRSGSIGEATANRDMQVKVASQQAESVDAARSRPNATSGSKASLRRRPRRSTARTRAKQGQHRRLRARSRRTSPSARPRRSGAARWRWPTPPATCWLAEKEQELAQLEKDADRPADDRAQEDRDRRRGRGRADPARRPGVRPTPCWPSTRRGRGRAQGARGQGRRLREPGAELRRAPGPGSRRC